MPLDSATAKVWLAANIRRKGKHAPADLPRPPRPTSDDNNDLVGAKNLAARMFDLAMSAVPATAQGLVAAYLKSLESIAVIERTMVARATDARELMHSDTVRSMLAERDSKFQQRKDQLL
jgi:hypothetical protein